jgi:hypothetical protein
MDAANTDRTINNATGLFSFVILLIYRWTYFDAGISQHWLNYDQELGSSERCSLDRRAGHEIGTFGCSKELPVPSVKTDEVHFAAPSFGSPSMNIVSFTTSDIG